MKKFFTIALLAILPSLVMAQGWPAKYKGVMLQGFYWDSYDQTRWTKLESQADELAEFFDLVWLPQSGSCGGTSMGYDDLYWFNNYNSSFGNERQLRSLINTFKSKGIGTIADVVINHRKELHDWFYFPTETYKGVTYEMTPADVTANDDGGATATEAAKQGVSLSPNNDTGEDWGGMRDLDHISANVQKCVNAYLGFLLNDLGYAGFRYDMVKGYSASYTGKYNSAANPTYSVGEYWDSSAAIINWLENTKVNGNIMSAAFDFQFRYTVRNAVNNANWQALGQPNENRAVNWPIVGGNANSGGGKYRRYAVTFVENHDTEERSADNQQDPIRKDIAAANAYMMMMPGTPCVFLKHWINYKSAIKNMIYLRKMAGIHNESATQNLASSTSYYVQVTTGDVAKLMIIMGTTSAYTAPDDYVSVQTGTHYKMLLEKKAETAWVNQASGEFQRAFNVTMTAVSTNSNAKLVYTTDGSEPTAASTQVTSGARLNIAETTTLKVGLLVGSTVKGVVTRYYKFTSDEPFEPYTITVYLKDPTVAPNNWSQVVWHVWDSKEQNLSGGQWPGEVMTQTKEIKGTKFYYHSYDITEKDYYVNFVFNQGGDNASEHQTEDVRYVDHDAYFEIATQINKYQVNDITDQYEGGGYARGDVNGDGVIDVKDLADLIDVVLGKIQPTALPGDCHVAGGESIDVNDVSALINIILGK